MALSTMEQEIAARKRDTAYLGTLKRKADFMEKEQAALDRQGDAFLSARQRRLASQNMTALTDPGRYAPQVYKQAKQWYDQGGLRDHELAMLKQQDENEFNVAEQKRFGMKEQGADAARLNAEATKHGWNKQLEMEEKRQSGLTEREKMIGDRTERIAGMEHGTIGPDGKVTPGSRERVAGINADAVAQQAELKRQHELELEREKTLRNADTNQTRVVVGAGHDQARRDAAGAQQQRADQRGFESWIVGELGRDPNKWTLTDKEREGLKGMSVEEQKAFYAKKFGRGTSSVSEPPARRSWRDRYGTANK